MPQRQRNNSRRKFLRSAALAGGSLMIVPRHVLGRGFIAPSDKITIGIIGLGKKGMGHAKDYAKLHDAQIIAGCDVWSTKRDHFSPRLEALYEEQNKKNGGVKTYALYEELLETDVDAIIVSTPDHWHALPAAAAMKAGKDVFCEKPLTHTIEEGRMLVNLSEKHQRIFQTGSQQRSNDHFRRACELVRNGYIGDIQKILVDVGDPAIDYNLPEEKPVAGLDWERWCGPSPMIHYNRFLAPETHETRFWPKWRDFKETGGGILSDWGAHMFDIAQWGIGMDHSGPVSLIPPKDPKAVRGLRLLYANGVEMVHEDFGRGRAVRFIGSEGHIDVSRKFFEASIDGLTEVNIKKGETALYRSEDHNQNWLDCIKSRQVPICPAEVGHRTNSVSCISNIAYWLNKPLEWNPEKEKFTDKAANKHLSKKNRKPYQA